MIIDTFGRVLSKMVWLCFRNCVCLLSLPVYLARTVSKKRASIHTVADFQFPFFNLPQIVFRSQWWQFRSRLKNCSLKKSSVSSGDSIIPRTIAGVGFPHCFSKVTKVVIFVRHTLPAAGISGSIIKTDYSTSDTKTSVLWSVGTKLKVALGSQRPPPIVLPARAPPQTNQLFSRHQEIQYSGPIFW